MHASPTTTPSDDAGRALSGTSSDRRIRSTLVSLPVRLLLAIGLVVFAALSNSGPAWVTGLIVGLGAALAATMITRERRGRARAPSQLYDVAERIAGIGHWWQPAPGAELHLSPALAEMLEVEASSLPASALVERFEPADSVRSVLDRTSEVSSVAVELVSGTGEGRAVRVSVEAVGEGPGCPVVGTVKDLSEDLDARQDELEVQARLHERQRLETVGRLAGGVAHDFNNLLTIITGSSALARDSDEVERGELLDELDEAAQRASGLVRELLAYARKQVLRPARIELAATVEDLLPLLRRLAPVARIEVKRDTVGALWLEADRGQLEQVVVNLVDNAQRAVGETGHIELRTGVVSSGPEDTPLVNQPCAYLVVSDDGVGMDPVTRRRIFEPFFSTRDPSSGAGLGLATVYGVVAQSGGHIEVQSELGEGTTFRIFLPLKTQSPNPTPEVPISTPRSARVVLVIDDEQLVLRMTCRLLERAGYEVLPALGPEDARVVFETHRDRIGIVLCDVLMPGTDGIQLMAELKAMRADLRFILMSGYSTETIQRHGFDPADVTMLRKPFARHALLEAIRRSEK